MENPMTVKELIEFLQKQPPDALVLYELFSDYDPLTPDLIQTVPREGKPTDDYGKLTTERLICRNGHYMLARETWIQPGDVHPPFAAVVFPGN